MPLTTSKTMACPSYDIHIVFVLKMDLTTWSFWLNDFGRAVVGDDGGGTT
jgi:hypothetical protein